MSTTEHRRWLEAEAKRADRAMLKRARERVKIAQRERRQTVKRAATTCDRARKRLKIWLLKERARVHAQVQKIRTDLRARIASERTKARTCCGPDRERVRAEALEQVARARAALEELRGRAVLQRLWSRKDARGPQLTRADRRSESDSQVEAELSTDELIVWRAVKGQIKASPRMSRFEAFAHWMHEHRADVLDILEADAQRAVDDLERQEYEQREAMRELDYATTNSRSLRSRAQRARSAADVPF